MTRRPNARWLLMTILALALVACQSARQPPAQAPTSPASSPGDLRPRSFQLGLSSLPPELTEESYRAAFALVGEAGDVVLIQRTPPWEEMLSGDLSESTVSATEREVRLARDHGLDLFVAIDPTDPGEGRHAVAGLPAELQGAGFAHPDVRRALLAYARYVAENYRPKYLAFGVEINSYQRAEPRDFEEFVRLYHQAYTTVKQLSPETLVFPTFQFEDLQGFVPPDDPQVQQWYLLNRFEPNLDLFAVSTYPRATYRDLAELPDAYFAQAAAYTKKPLAIAGTGYPSEPEAEADVASEAEQAEFLRLALDSAQVLGMPLFVWFVGQDPSYTGEAPFDRLRTLGLLRQDGSAKEAWDVWRSAAARPFVAAEP